MEQTTTTDIDPSTLPLPPGSFGLPLVGETLEWAREYGAFVEERRRRHGDVFRTHLLGQKTVFVLGAEANRWLFANEGKAVENRWNDSAQRLFGPDCVATMTGEAHQRRRRLLAPHFSVAAMQRFVPQMESLARRHFERWADTPGSITVWDRLRALIFEAIVGLTIGQEGVDVDRLSRTFSTFTGGLWTPVPVDLPFLPYGKARRAAAELRSTLGALVKRRREQAEPSRDIVSSLIQARDEDGQPLSDDAIVSEVILQLFAGHDTTHALVGNVMVLLSLNPEVWARGRAEAAALPPGEPLSMEALKRVPYVGWIINEGLRRVPPASGAFRVATRDVAFGGYRIPAGWTIAYSISHAHQFGAGWTEREAFDPARFSPERAEHKQPSCSFIPFAGGPRACVGQHLALVESSVLLTLLLRDYAWDVVPGQDLTYVNAPFTRPKSGLQVRFRRRGAAEPAARG